MISPPQVSESIQVVWSFLPLQISVSSGAQMRGHLLRACTCSCGRQQPKNSTVSTCLFCVEDGNACNIVLESKPHKSRMRVTSNLSAVSSPSTLEPSQHVFPEAALCCLAYVHPHAALCLPSLPRLSHARACSAAWRARLCAA